MTTCVLIAIVKHELQLYSSFYTCEPILTVSVFEKTEISCALQRDIPQIDLPETANQLKVSMFRRTVVMWSIGFSWPPRVLRGGLQR